MTDKIEALETQVANADSPQEKIDRLNDLAQALADTDPARAQELATEARQLANSATFAAAPYIKGIANSLQTLAAITGRQGHYQEANVHLEEALALYEEIDDKAGCAAVLQTLAFNQARLGNLPIAVNYGVRSLALAEEIGDMAQKAGALSSLAAATSQMGEHEQALRYYDQTLEIHEQTQDYERLSVTLNNIAYTYLLAGNYPEALQYARQGLELIAEHKVEAVHELYLINNAAHAYRHLGQYHEALQLYKQNIAHLEQRDDTIVRLANLLGTGQIYLKQGDLDQAETVLQEALLLAEETRAQPFYYECHQTLAELYQQQGEYEQALAHYSQFHALKEQVYNEETSRSAKRLEIQYQLEVARREAELSQQQYALLEQENAERNAAEMALRQSQETLQDFLEKQQRLVEINVALSRTGNVDELCHRAIELGRELLGFDRLGLFLLDEAKEEVVGTYGTDDQGNVRREAHIVFTFEEQPSVREWIHGEVRVAVDEDTELYNDNEIIGRGWNIRTLLWQEDKSIGLLFADNLLNQRPLRPYEPDLLSAYSTVIANLIMRKRAEYLLSERIKALNCLTDIGYKIDETPPIPEFLQWLTGRIPSAMQYPDICVAAITYQDQVYGPPAAIELPGQIVQGIRIGNERVGRLYIAYQEKRDFLNEESALMGGIVRRVAGYLENQQLIAQTQAALTATQAAQRTVQHRADIEKIGAAVSAGFLDLMASEIDEGFTQALEMIGKFTGVDRAYMFLIAPDGTTMSNTHEWSAPGIMPHITELQHLPTEEFNFLLSYINHLDIFYVPRTADLPDAVQIERTEFQREGIQSIICVPLISYGKAIGFIGFDAVRQETDWQAEDIALLRLVADTFVSALRRKETEEKLSKQAEELQTVADVSTAVATTLNPKKLLQDVVNLTKARFNLYHAHIYLLDETGQRLVLTAGAGTIGQRMVAEGRIIDLSQEQSLVARAARSRQGVIVNDVQADPGFLPHSLLPHTRAEMAVPIVAGEQMLGVLDVQSHEVNRFTEEDVQIQTTLATQTAVALQNARQYERTQAVLTGVQESQQFLDSLINTIPNPIFYKDTNGVYLGFNQAFLDYLGQPAEVLLGKTIFDLETDNELIAKYHALDMALLKNPEQAQVYEANVKYADGSLHDVIFNKNAFYNLDGSLGGLVGVIIDITERKKAEQLLQEEKDRSQTILESLGTPIVIAKVADGTIIYVNEPLADLILVSREELIGQITPDFFYEPANRSAYVTALREKGNVTNYEVRLKRGDGEPFWALLSGQIMRFEGELVTITSLIDISDRKEAEALLHLRNTALEAAADGIAITNTIGEIQWVNAAFTKLTQYSYDEAIGNNPRVLKSGVHDPDFYKNMWRLLSSGQIWQGEIVNRRKDGTLYTEEMSITPVQTKENETTHYIAIKRDISERKRVLDTLAQQAADLQTVADLSTTISNSLDTEDILQTVVNLAKTRFNLYHAHIYLLNATKNRLVLAAGAGEVGRKMIEQGHSIPLSQERSLVVQAARRRTGVRVNDVRQDPSFLPNPLLPDTHSELAVPMIVGDTLLGVLDVQSDQVDRFQENDVNIQMTLAAQIAVALDNARSLERAQKALADLNQLTQRLTREGWEAYLANRSQVELTYVFSAEQLEEESQVVSHPLNGNEAQIKQTLRIHGETIGQLAIVPGDEVEETYDEETAIIINAVAEQLSARIENIRLTEQMQTALAETEDQALRLSKLNEVAAALNAAQSADEVFQIAAEQTLSIINGNRASITLLSEEGSSMTVMALSGTTAKLPIGATFPLAQQQSLATAVSERRVVIEENLQTETTENLTDSYSSIVAPILSGTRVLGTLNVGAAQTDAFDANDINLMRQMTALVASTLENQRLLEETQARAEQLAAINRISRTLSQYLDEEQLLEAAYEEIKQTIQADSFYVGLYEGKSDTIRFPIFYEGEKRIPQQPIPVNPQGYSYRVIHHGETILHNLTPEESAQIAQTNAIVIGDRQQPQSSASLIFVPLQAGQRVLGVISAQSYQFNAYTTAEEALLSGIAGYLAVALENVRLFTETERRAAQLQALSEVETALSQAVTEEEILTAVSLSIEFATELPTLSLEYIDTDKEGRPQTMHTVAVWDDGLIQPDHEMVGQTIKLRENLYDWLTRANEVNLIADIATAKNVNDAMKQTAQQAGFNAMAVLPLQSAGRWQGAINITWQTAHEFTESDQFLLRQIIEPVAAVVASRRAQLAQQQALALTDNLYRAGRRINAAGPDLQAAIAAVAEAAPIPAVNRLVFFLFEFTPAGQLEAIRSVANWYSGHGAAPPPLNLRYTTDLLQGLEAFVTRETLIFNDTQDGKLSPTMQHVLQRLQIPSMAVIPLWIGTRQLGSILVETADPFIFNQAELEPYVALVDQLAIAADRQRLLQQAQVRAERERQIRTITDKIRRGVDREAILRIAREEIAQLLGASTSVTQLGTREQLLQQLQKLTKQELDLQAT